MSAAFQSLLACAKCQGCLTRCARSWRCDSCGQDFADVGALACLLPDPGAARAEWATAAREFHRMMGAAAGLLSAELRRHDLLPTTRSRLEALRHGNQLHCRSLLELLAAAGVAPAPVASETGAERAAELPAMIRDYELILRDWAWESADDAENARALSCVLDACGARPPPARVLVLGAGAARLASELHRRLEPQLTVALDNNPLGLLVARAVLDGRPTSLHEFPFAPDEPGSSAVCYLISRCAAASAGLELVVGDARALPFRGSSFDLVLTPWFIDVVDLDLDRLLSVIHRQLAPGGCWINHGPLLYPGYRAPSERRGISEVLQLVAWGGFEVSRQRADDLLHLAAPQDTRRHRERVYTFCAEKAPFVSSDDQAEPPAWQLLAHRPVPLLAIARSPSRATHPLLLAAASCVDGVRTTEEIARALATHPDVPAGTCPLSLARALLWHLSGSSSPS